MYFKKEKEDREFWAKVRKYSMYTCAGIAGCAIFVCGAAWALGLAGFTSAGIAGGSIAAGIQSSIGAVTAGSAFATLQSLGATGTIAAIGYGSAATAAVAGGTALAISASDREIRSNSCNYNPPLAIQNPDGI